MQHGMNDKQLIDYITRQEARYRAKDLRQEPDKACSSLRIQLTKKEGKYMHLFEQFTKPPRHIFPMYSKDKEMQRIISKD